jgi:hypothetical protein
MRSLRRSAANRRLADGSSLRTLRVDVGEGRMVERGAPLGDGRNCSAYASGADDEHLPGTRRSFIRVRRSWLLQVAEDLGRSADAL